MLCIQIQTPIFLYLYVCALCVSNCIYMYVLVCACMHIHIALGLRLEISARREAHLALNQADKMHSKLQKMPLKSLGLEHPTPRSYLTTCNNEPLGYIQHNKIYVYVLFCCDTFNAYRYIQYRHMYIQYIHIHMNMNKYIHIHPRLQHTPMHLSKQIYIQIDTDTYRYIQR